MTDYFFILTIQWTEGHVVNVRTRNGIVESVRAGTTQQEIFEGAYADSCEFFNAPKTRSSVSYYYLAKNGA